MHYCLHGWVLCAKVQSDIFKKGSNHRSKILLRDTMREPHVHPKAKFGSEIVYNNIHYYHYYSLFIFIMVVCNSANHVQCYKAQDKKTVPAPKSLQS